MNKTQKCLRRNVNFSNPKSVEKYILLLEQMIDALAFTLSDMSIPNSNPEDTMLDLIKDLIKASNYSSLDDTSLDNINPIGNA